MTITEEESLGTRQQAILEAIEKAGKPLAPKQIAKVTGLSATNVRNGIREMLEAGLVEQPKYGLYQLPGRDNGAGGKAQVEEEAAEEAGEEEEARRLPEPVRIETLSVELAAGTGAFNELELVDGAVYFTETEVRRQFGAPPSRVKRVKVIGDSMRPTIMPGEYVYIVLLEPGQEPLNGGVYVLRGPYGAQIKRLYFRDETLEREGKEEVRRYVWLWSDNEEAGRDRIPLDVFQRDYVPVAYLRRTEREL